MKSLSRKTFCLLFFSLFFFLVQARESQLRPIGESEYFSLHGYRNIDIPELIEKINFSYSEATSRGSRSSSQSPQAVLEKTLDALFLEVSAILDIRVPRFHGTIKFVPDQGWVNDIFKSYVGRNFPERSFYLYEKNTIYISTADITLGMLGHEIAHAIMCRYFAVPPSHTIQEVLAGYVEYSLTR